MITQKHAELESAAGVRLPHFQMFTIYSGVANTAEGSQVAFEGLLVHVLIGLGNCEISAQDRNHHFEQLGMLEHFGGCTV